MKDYMVVHTFKSEEIRQQYFAMGQDMTLDDIRAQMKNDNASARWSGQVRTMVILLVESQQPRGHS